MKRSGLRAPMVSAVAAFVLLVAAAAPASAYTSIYLTPTLPSGTATGIVAYAGGANPDCRGGSTSSASADKASTTDLYYGCTWVATSHWYRPSGSSSYYKTYTGLKVDYAGTSVTVT